MSENILTISDLHTSFFTPVGEVKAVGGVSLKLAKGEVLGIVGESGSGKSVTMLSMLHLLGPSGKVVAGSVNFEGQELTTMNYKQMSDIRANKISMIFQDPMTSLNPVLSISYQLCEPLIRHKHMNRPEAKKRVIELRDTTIDGKTVTDTLSIMTYEGSSSDSKSDKGWKHHNSSGWDWDFDLDGKTSETIISVTAIVFIFGLPLLIVFTVFFFNYKNRKAKYRLAEQALSSGQQLPEDFFKNAEKTEDIRTKGIKNIFIGIGLFIFLWAITENFGVGCVGLLIMFTGFGQLVIYYTQDSNKKNNRER